MAKSWLLSALLVLRLAAWPVAAYDVASTVSPSIVAGPIEVVIWVKPGVAPDDLDRSLAAIREGLDLWENVPTSAIRFDVVDVVESVDEPQIEPEQLLIILANREDLPSGGASLPDRFGNPGTWFGAVADLPTLRLAEVTAHEIGHCLGFLHSTVSVAFPLEERPIMHFALSGDGLTADDVAMVSTTYPDPAGPALADVTARIRGRVVDATSGAPIDGVNVVAVDAVTGVPAVARVSGAEGPPGAFEIVGLAQGVYDVLLLDGYSFRGSFVGLGSGREISGRFQVDNFEPAGLEAIPASPGAEVALGDVALPIAPIAVAGVHVGDGGTLGDARALPAVGFALPATDRRPYEIWLHLTGGVRPLDGEVTGLPSGLTGRVRVDPRSPNVGIQGQHFVHVDGFPQEAGTFAVTVAMADLEGDPGVFDFELTVDAACPAEDRDGDGLVDCDDACLDTDGDGFGEVGGAFGGACLGGDCDDGDAATFPGAPEVNDGLDNQCPGDPGFGLVDETSGRSGFVTPGDRATYSWPAQAGATLYEVARSATPDFSMCLRITTAATEYVDTEVPATRQLFHYLNRPLEPNGGSWGRGTYGRRDDGCL